jgi:hypothetical protein
MAYNVAAGASCNISVPCCVEERTVTYSIMRLLVLVKLTVACQAFPMQSPMTITCSALLRSDAPSFIALAGSNR